MKQVTPTNAPFHNLCVQFLRSAYHYHRVTTQLQLINIIIIIITCFGAVILPSLGTWHQNFFKTYSNKLRHNKHICVVVLWPILLLYVVKKFWSHVSEGGEIIAPKHVGAVLNIVSTNYGMVYLLVSRELFTS